MNYGSVCSGIEAATVAWHGLGWKPSFFSEIDTFPRKVLAHHYPDTPLHGDFTTIKKDDYEPIELLVGGTPCQSFSVAGLREGLNDPRGNLMLEFGALADRLHPKWLVWENVPGVLSSNGGRDFASFLGMLGQLGYGFAYRVLDAQYFGVPQRRRRVFVVGCFGDWRSAAAVLFERHSLQGNPSPSRSKGQEVAGTISANSFTGGAGGRPEGATGNHFIPTGTCSGKETFGTLMANCGQKQWLGNQEALSGDYHVFDKSPSFGIPGNWIGRKPENGGNAVEPMHDVAPCLTKTDQHGVSSGMQVRRLTPVECERLQGFPDNYTNIPGASDSHRYKALGNSMAVPVMSWLGERIQMVESIGYEVRKAA
jgi:DNA (cytosine-5)-methyltransferase 1